MLNLEWLSSVFLVFSFFSENAKEDYVLPFTPVVEAFTHHALILETHFFQDFL
jgi:hypothetical protein